VTDDCPRSSCAINRTLEIIGDRWSMLIIRDIMFAGKRHFCELLACEESISSNILATRLKNLVAHGVLTKADDPSHKQKAVYSLTEQGLALLPLLAEMQQWGAAQLVPPSRRGVRSPGELTKLASELRAAHLGRSPRRLDPRAPRRRGAAR